MTIQVLNAHQPTYAIIPFDHNHRPPTKALAQLHCQILPRSPISLLGRRFAQKVYYGLLSQNDLMFGAVAYMNNQPIGFIAVTTHPQDFMQIAIKRHFIYISSIIALSTIAHPIQQISGIWQALSIMRHLPTSNINTDEAELLSFGVVAEYRYSAMGKQIGHHVARDLLHSVITQLASRHQTSVRAIVDQDNIAAQIFYQRSGWQVRQKSVPGWHVPSIELALSLDQFQPTPLC
jgi:ribosomal protein S18 acetylase RimI-like enzyme